MTKVEIHQSTTEKLLDCMSFGDDGYVNYVQSRLVDKDTPLQAPIPANRSYFEGVSEPPKKKAKVLDKDNTTEALVRYIDYTEERGYDTKQLLEFELSDSPLYLVNENIKKDGLLTKSAKAQLANELVKKLSVAERNYQNCSPDMVVFDFMGIVRELPIKTTIPKIRTFGELSAVIFRHIKTLSRKAKRVDIVLDIYHPDSIKETERKRRGIEDKIKISMIASHEQKLPVDLEMFWGSGENKMIFQNYFCGWLAKYNDSIELIYVGGLRIFQCKQIVKSSGEAVIVEELSGGQQEEADARMMLHVNHVEKKGVESVLVCSKDTDVFVFLLYHQQETFPDIKELFVRMGGRRSTRKIVPLHLLSKELDPLPIECLPAIHAITGCDTTSKVAAKTSIFSKSTDLNLIKDFGKRMLTTAMLKKAETFILQLLGKEECASFNELRYIQYYDSQKHLSLTKLVCCSSSLQYHLKRAYLQTHIWLNGASQNPYYKLEPTSYGYNRRRLVYNHNQG